jgi:hypothetical protein
MRFFTLPAVALAMSSVLLASCGGGGDVAGDSSDFSLSPTELKLTVISEEKGDCRSSASASPAVVTIIGGQPPFRIVNSTTGLVVDKTEATGKDPQFTVRPNGACGDPFIVTVLDYHSKVTVLEYTVEDEQPEEDATPEPDL